MSTPEVNSLIKSVGRASIVLERARETQRQADEAASLAREAAHEAYKELTRLEDLLLKAIKGEGPVEKNGS
jgi:hypothetical protein